MTDQTVIAARVRRYVPVFLRVWDQAQKIEGTDRIQRWYLCGMTCFL